MCISWITRVNPVPDFDTYTISLPPVRKASKKKKLKWKTGVVQYHNLKNKLWDLEKVRREAPRIWRSKHSLWLWLLAAGPRAATVGLKTCRREVRSRTHKTGQEMKWKTASITPCIKTSFFLFYNLPTIPQISVPSPLPRLISPFYPCTGLSSHTLSFLTSSLECSRPWCFLPPPNV